MFGIRSLWKTARGLSYIRCSTSHLSLETDHKHFSSQVDASCGTGVGKYKTLLVKSEDGVCTITFNRPSRLNAFTFELCDELADAFQKADEDPSVVVAAVTGVGRFFGAGNDLSNFPAGHHEPDSPTSPQSIVLKIMTPFINFKKPVVAAVNGPAVGGSVTFLAHCDLVYASTKATFHTPFTSMALVPEGGSSFLFPRIVGPMASAKMLLFSQKITAEEACKIGLVSEVFPHETFEEEVWGRLREYAKLPVKSLIYSKALYRLHIQDKVNETIYTECARLLESVASDEHKEFLEKFFSKNK